MKKENPMPDFTKMEHEIGEYWESKNVFSKLKEQNSKTGKYYAFLDGPITANNEMKLHHVWNRALKDIMLKYKAMNGFDSCYQNGFDAQGLWVEVNVEKELGLKDKKDIENYGMGNFVEKCMSNVKKFSGQIANQSKRLGQWMDWDNSYYTNSDTNIESIWFFLSECYKKGWLIEKYRPMPWCAKCGTSLSEHELADSYMDMEHEAVFFKLPIKDSDMDILVWTTTPWTLSSNVAVAVNNELKYSVCNVKSSERKLVVCEDAIKVLKGDLESVEKTILGSELVGKAYTTCFEEFSEQNFEHKIVAWDAVDATEGSGAVHIAPGCGAEDFELGNSLGLEVICPVDESGVFYNNFGFLSGKKTTEVADEVFEQLKNRGKLYYTHKYMHRYPICWRCKNPLIFRLSKEWYLKVDEIRPQLIEAVETVEWQPAFSKKRMLDWLNNMGDWNISRKRFYGLPLPFYRCEHCGELTVVKSREQLKELSGSDKVDCLPHLHRPYIDDIEIKCPKCGKSVKRVSEVGDCWLDAGITWLSTKKYFTDKEFFEKNFPVEVVIEMKEQIRLWFYSLLFTSVAITGKAPYKKVIGFAMLVAEDGTKFSKSGPNNLSFNELAEKYTSDVLRYIFASNNMQNDTRFGVSVCEETRRKLLGLWNTYIFFNTYACLDKPNLENYVLKNADVTDIWLLNRTDNFVKQARDAYETNQYFVVTKLYEAYIDDVSNWYIRVNRRRFWKSEEQEDKLNAYYCLYYAIKNTALVLAPITPFLSEYIYQNLVAETECGCKATVIMHDFPQGNSGFEDAEIEEKTKIARQIINLGQRLRNENNLKIKQPLNTMFVSLNKEMFDKVEIYKNIILDELNIKNFEYEMQTTKFNDEYLQVNFKSAGAVLKGDVQKVRQELIDCSEETMQQYVEMFKNNSVNICGFENLESSLFVLCYKPKQDYVVCSENDITVVLDITVNEELMHEGLSREIIRAIQVERKESGFNIEQRINLNITSIDETMNAVITKFKDKIAKEALVKHFGDFENAKVEKEIEIAGEKVTIKLGE